MKPLVKALSFCIVLLMGAGYLGSLHGALTGTAADYAARIDQPQVSFVALLLLIGCIVIGFLPEREEELKS